MTAVPNPLDEIIRYVDYEYAPSRLRELDPTLDIEILRSAVWYAYQDHASKMDVFAPTTGQGVEMYIHTTKLLRERLCTECKWSILDKKGVACVVSPEKKLYVACIGGDQNTGNKDGIPRVHIRGNGTKQVYGQQTLPGFEPLHQDPHDMSFWYLVTYIDVFGGTVRAEFSCPVISDDGCVNDWVQRIDLGPFGHEPLYEKLYDSSVPPTIDVTRKAV